MSTPPDPRELLRRIGTLADQEIELGPAALALAALDRPGVDLAWYRRHLADLAAAVRDHLGPHADDIGHRETALATVLCRHYGYRGDREHYDDLDNANLIRVIDRRRGLPIALGILFLETARAQGWTMVGLTFPGHFLVRLEHGNRRVILDPFDGGVPRAVAELRALVKSALGADAELTPDHFVPIANREILLRLQNNIKLRLLQRGEVTAAATIIDSMLMVAPHSCALWRERGVVEVRQGNLVSALRAFETALGYSRDEPVKAQIAGLIDSLRTTLN